MTCTGQMDDRERVLLDRIHIPGASSYYCAGCGQLWPCDLRRLLDYIAAQANRIRRLEVLMAWLDPAICCEDDSPITAWLGVEWSTWESIDRVDREVAEIRLRGVEHARQAKARSK